MRGENEPALIVLVLPRTPHLFASMEVFVFGLYESGGADARVIHETTGAPKLLMTKGRSPYC